MFRNSVVCPSVLGIVAHFPSSYSSTVWWQPCIRMGLLLLWVPFLNGCSLGFIWQAAVGQVKLLARQQPVERVLQNGTLSEQERQKVRLILDVRTFAAAQLGLHGDGSYTTFVDVGGPYVSYNVSAAPKDALQPYVWWFPIVGRVPYKGYFKQASALREARQLKAKGYDTYVRGVRAYSTLGYFDDPILSSMLAYHDFVLMSTIIHELLHQTVWVKGSVSFNESLANFVGDQGTLLYLAQRHGADSPVYQHYLDLHADAEVFREYMQSIVARLEALYAQPLGREEKLQRREELFADAKAAYPQVFPRMKTTAYQRYFERQTLNNAVMLSFRRYHQDTEFFETALAARNGDLRRFIAYCKSLRPHQIPATFRTP
jgi:predicted aminopeptidase